MSEIQFCKTKLIFGKPIAFTPLVSIAIPTYRRLYLLREAIESALCQKKCSPYEVIVLDNDQSLSIFNVVNSFDPSKIAVYQNSTNLGMWGNMNRALELAKGEWILILHDDDLLMPNALQVFESLISSCNNQEIGCLAGGVELFFTGERKPLFDKWRSQVRFPISLKEYQGNDIIPITEKTSITDIPKFCSSFYRREYIKQIGGWDPKFYGYADVALILQIAKDNKLFTCKEIFGRLRVHDDNDSHPSKLWESYPIKAAQRLLSCYVDESTIIGRGIYLFIERKYITALWKRQYTAEERRIYANEVLRLLNVKSVNRRFLLRNAWLLDLLSKLYGAIRPRLGSISRLVFRGSEKRPWEHKGLIS